MYSLRPCNLDIVYVKGRFSEQRARLCGALARWWAHGASPVGCEARWHRSVPAGLFDVRTAASCISGGATLLRMSGRSTAFSGARRARSAALPSATCRFLRGTHYDSTQRGPERSSVGIAQRNLSSNQTAGRTPGVCTALGKESTHAPTARSRRRPSSP